MYYSYGIIVWWIFCIFLFVFIFVNRRYVPGARINGEITKKFLKKDLAAREIERTILENGSRSKELENI